MNINTISSKKLISCLKACAQLDIELCEEEYREVPIKEIAPIHLELVKKSTTRLWNEYIDRYHYLGYKPLPGAQLRYFVQATA